MKRSFDDLDIDFSMLSISNKKERQTIEKHKKKQKKKKPPVGYANTFNFPELPDKPCFSRKDLIKILEQRDAILLDKLLKYAREDNKNATTNDVLQQVSVY